MLTEICKELRNWFEREKYIGTIKVTDGRLTDADDEAFPIADGQYVRVVGSVFNDGVYKFSSTSSYMPESTDEVFDGAVWAMAIPPQVIALAQKIEAWQAKYGGVDSVNMSPYNSESFGGYSYSKSGGGAGADGSSVAGTWQGAFASELNRWRKI